MATAIMEPSVCDRRSATLPPLENGDRLTRAEFERRYEAMPELKKAELIEGVVYMPSPVRCSRHGEPQTQIAGLAVCLQSRYARRAIACDNATVRLDLDNEPQPDASLIIDPARGGQARISQDDYLEGAPELVAEVASSSASYDLHVKLHVYRRSGVREYLVWRVLDRQIDWFVLREGQYEALAPGSDGILKSTVFPGLWLDPSALLRGDLAAFWPFSTKECTAPNTPNLSPDSQRRPSSQPVPSKNAPPPHDAAKYPSTLVSRPSLGLQLRLRACRRCHQAGFLDDRQSIPIARDPEPDAPLPEVLLVGQAPGLRATSENRPFAGRRGRAPTRLAGARGHPAP